MQKKMIRIATREDIPALLDLENSSFRTDRLSPRRFRYFLTKAHACLFVFEEDSRLLGYSLVLFHKNTSLARLYSIAVSQSARGRGIGRALINAAEESALDHKATRIRLEVHQNNQAAQDLYRREGYKVFARYLDYYEDHADALRMEKHLAKHLARDLDRVPYYRQTLDFTCGPSCLIMAMRAQSPNIPADRILELKLWREATTIFMTSGHGGCGALGLALAAHKRGFPVSVSMSDETGMFLDSVRTDEKRQVVQLVEEDFQARATEAGIPVSPAPMTAGNLIEQLDRGAIPIVLISTYRLTGDKVPHWVVVTAHDDRFLYINDPFADEKDNRSDLDCIGIPIAPAELERMMRFGAKKHYAAIIMDPPHNQIPGPQG
ncbi:GNAT family N-acetyltransferase/peptidase C39 family protein [Aestuariispira insulae]|uniref:Ribosomal-protein-alanine acetyltransferase n=1 Tax=Aestuariispira insulae TaxID=1461337 RepID=A0A3D9H3W1_9PROT|nr:GNAT family N-acetyltransferase/peptidase C39 family protein [Aestuariispira insulae]RED44170.1 ribosomal-protein-alanine acetyltransferase [Aestuariispira insulae]